MISKAFDSHGMSVLSDEEKAKAKKITPMILLVLFFVPTMIGLAIALPIYFLGSLETYNSKISSVVLYDLQWLFLSALVLGKLISHLNGYPLLYKSQIMSRDAGNLRGIFIQSFHTSDIHTYINTFYA